MPDDLNDQLEKTLAALKAELKEIDGDPAAEAKEIAAEAKKAASDVKKALSGEE